MKKTGLLAIALAGAALMACAPRYGYHDSYEGRYHRNYAPGGVYYTDRDRYNDSYYSEYPSREYRDRDYDRRRPYR